MDIVKWGIIGPGNIAKSFADGLKQSRFGELVAIASTNQDRRKSFGDKYNIKSNLRFETYDDIIESSQIDAIYISTPHTLHAEWTVKAASKGKHVLCEKPGAVNLKEGKQVIQAVKEAGVFYMEGFMYRCHPQIKTLLKLIKEKQIGEIKSIKSSFGFDTGKVIPKSRLFNKELAGGAILDVGLYPISFSRLVAGVASGKKFLNPSKLTGSATIGETGVDEVAYAKFEFENDIVADASTAIRKEMANNAIITGSKGTIEMSEPWTPGKEGEGYHSTIKININDNTEIFEIKGPEHLFYFEAELASLSIKDNKLEVPHPGMTWEDTLGNLKTLDDWREQVGYSIQQDLTS